MVITMAFSYMSVRGKELPLWFVILVAVSVVGTAVSVFVYMLRFSKAEQNNKEEAPNYLGKDRLVRILSHYILGRYGEELHDSFVSELTECKEKRFYVEQKRQTGVFFMYTQTTFPACNEWIKCICCGYDFMIEAYGEKAKRVTITDYCYENEILTHFFTYYDEDFRPKPNETSFYDGTGRCTVFKPFTDRNTTYNGIKRDACVCYDIGKGQ